MPQEGARYLYLKHQLSAASELSHNKYDIPVGFNHAPVACIKTSNWKFYNYYRDKYMILYYFPIAQNTGTSL